ncbi:MAG: hypothetical protein ACRC6J_02895 [Cetobacterium sp.]
MSEENIKKLLKGKNVDELLNLLILGLENRDTKTNVIQTFQNIKSNTETA